MAPVAFVLIALDAFYTSALRVESGASIMPAESAKIPKVIWSFWDKGRPRAPISRRMCFDSFEEQNPGWEFRVLNLAEAESLIQRSRLISDKTWNSMAVQAKSDVIRINLLASYGGVWVDATVYCNSPLDKWLDRSLKVFFLHNHPQGGILLHSTRMPPLGLNGSQWSENMEESRMLRFASWFMGAQRSSALIQALKTKVNDFWNAGPKLSYEYFWLHHLFYDLVKADSQSLEEFKQLGMWSTDAAYCQTSNFDDAPFYKFDHNCNDVRADLLEEYRFWNQMP